MPLDNTSAGFSNYSSYATPGVPHIESKAVTGIYKFVFPLVTQEIMINNNSNSSIKYGFSDTAFAAGRTCTLLASGSVTLDVRATSLHVSASAGQLVEVFASLSLVNSLQMINNLSGTLPGV